MKIGIATPFNVMNYGTKLQAYAIQTVIQRIAGEENVEIINYHHSSDKRFFVILKKIFSLKLIKARIAYKKKKLELVSNVGKYSVDCRKKAIESIDILYNMSPKVEGYRSLCKMSEKYDAVVCGSDQIWIPQNLKTHYYTLEFFSGEHKIAYAASFGVDKIMRKDSWEYKRFLEKLIFIGVRENSGKRIVDSIMHKDIAKVVCDPTFLLSKEDWSTFVENRANAKICVEKYILCYFLGENSEHRKYVKRIAETTGYRIKAFVHFKGWVEADKDFADDELYSVTPEDFISLVAKAEIVCTDSMHATIFSLIFHTNFFTFQRFSNSDIDSRNTRIESLLSLTGHEDRLVSELRSIPEKIAIDNWDKTDLEIKKLQNNSLRLLREAIISCD